MPLTPLPQRRSRLIAVVAALGQPNPSGPSNRKAEHPGDEHPLRMSDRRDEGDGECQRHEKCDQASQRTTERQLMLGTLLQVTRRSAGRHQSSGTSPILVPTSRGIRRHSRASVPFNPRLSERGAPPLHTREVAGSKPAAPITSPGLLTIGRPAELRLSLARSAGQVSIFLLESPTNLLHIHDRTWPAERLPGYVLRIALTVRCRIVVLAGTRREVIVTDEDAKCI